MARRFLMRQAIPLLGCPWLQTYHRFLRNRPARNASGIADAGGEPSAFPTGRLALFTGARRCGCPLLVLLVTFAIFLPAKAAADDLLRLQNGTLLLIHQDESLRRAGMAVAFESAPATDPTTSYRLNLLAQDLFQGLSLGSPLTGLAFGWNLEGSEPRFDATFGSLTMSFEVPPESLATAAAYIAELFDTDFGDSKELMGGISELFRPVSLSTTLMAQSAALGYPAPAIVSLPPDLDPNVFFHRFTVPKRLSVAIVSPLVTGEEKEKIVELFGDRRPANETIEPIERPSPATERLVHTRWDSQLAQISLAGKLSSRSSKDQLICELLATELAGAHLSRLYQSLRREFGSAYYLRSKCIPIGDWMVISVETLVAPGDADSTADLLQKEVSRLARYGLGEDELAAIKEHYRGVLLLKAQEPAALASDLAVWARQSLGQSTNPRSSIPAAVLDIQAQSLLDSITVDDISLAAKELAGDMVIVVGARE